MNWKTMLSLTVAIVMGLAAMYVGKDLVMGKNANQNTGTKLVEIVFAKHDMDPGKALTADDLMTQAVPQEVASATAFTDPKTLNGRVLRASVVKGTPMQESLLEPPGADAGMGGRIPPGMRAVSIDVNDSSGVAGLIVPGSHVDVIATLRQQEGGDMARTIVQNAQVGAVNRHMGKIVDDPKSEPQQIKTVTLFVEPQDAESIQLAGEGSRLRLVLRNSSDTKATSSGGVNMAQISGLKEEPKVVAAPTTGPSGPSNMDKLVAAMQLLAQNARPPEQVMERRTVPVIRGGHEGVIIYERPKGAFKDPDEGWTVASHQPDQQPPAGGSSARDSKDREKDPFR